MILSYAAKYKFRKIELFQKIPSQAGQLDGQNFGPFKKKRTVKDTVNIVAGGHLAIQLGGENFGLPR
ncbi:hypothetical protein BpHYR1_046499 [Brachionus plicatilis]|uniref:Uncharacterized protein n=1 Tax=Brachionus plicatilis TaxID=10195 RepID=A0A3M7QPL6_BRAPC|nr:hypothetical protein BpHYR1_046499 [Brachionus plicatilis]